MSVIEVVKYNSDWPDKFKTEKQQIETVLTPLSVKIIHIGSTSVPDMAAKPVIDMLILLDNIEEIDLYNNKLEQMSYEAKGEFGIPDRRFFMKGGENRTHHIHAFTHNSPGAIRHLAFRDYLIAYPEIAAEYEALKKTVALNCNNDMQTYCDGKNDFIQHHEKLAVQWYSPREH